MITIIEQLIVLYKESGKSINEVSMQTGLSRPTVSGLLSGKNDDPNLSTLIDIADCLGAEICVQTAKSKAAISNDDITAYREMLAKLYVQIEKLTALNERQQSTIEHQQDTIEHQRATIESQRSTIAEQSKFLGRLQDSIDRKDEILRSRS